MDGQYLHPAYQFLALPSDYERSVRFLITRDDMRSGDRLTIAPFQFVEVPDPEDSHEVIAPTMTLRRALAQSLMDAMWNSGMRPTKTPVDSTGEIAALKHHLQDMRAIAFSHMPNAVDNKE